MTALDRSLRQTTILLLPLLACHLLVGCTRLESLVRPLHPVGTIGGRVELAREGGGAAGREIPVVTSHAQVWVYLEPVEPPTRHMDEPPTVEVAVRDGRQEPEMLFLNPGQRVRFRNLDAIFHELFTGDTDQGFRVRLEGGAVSDSIRLSERGFIRGYCSLHPDETFAFIVSDARRFVPLAADSRFEIADVSPGEYRIGAASAEAESDRVQVRVAANRTIELTLQLAPRSIQ